MQKSIEDHLQTIQSRLSETLEAFVVAREINEVCNKEADPNLFDTVNKRGGFWQAVLLSLQTTYLVGLNALLDKGRKDCATLYFVLDELESIHPGVLPSNLATDLDVIRNRYKEFRHKLFGHNDKDRDVVILNFNKAGFTWASQAQDLFKLEYAFKVLFEAMSEHQIPTEKEAVGMQFPYNDYVNRAAKDTMSLLDDLRV